MGSKNWISVEDRLPKIRGEYIVANLSPHHSDLRVDYCFFEDKWINEEHGYGEGNRIVYWQTFPEPPENK